MKALWPFFHIAVNRGAKTNSRWMLKGEFQSICHNILPVVMFKISLDIRIMCISTCKIYCSKQSLCIWFKFHNGIFVDPRMYVIYVYYVFIGLNPNFCTNIIVPPQKNFWGISRIFLDVLLYLILNPSSNQISYTYIHYNNFLRVYFYTHLLKRK